MHIDIPLDLLWLITLTLLAMCVASTWYQTGLLKKNKEQQAAYDVSCARSDAILAKCEEQQTRAAALMDRQDAVLTQAEELLKRFNERTPC